MRHIRKNIFENDEQKQRKSITYLIAMGTIAFCLLYCLYVKINETDFKSENQQLTEVIGSSSPKQAGQNSQGTLQNAKKPLWIQVTLSKQNVIIFDSNNQTIESFICSTGKEGDDTPVGTFTIKEKGESFFNKDYQQGAYYWTQFDGDYLFHSVPFDKNKTIDAVEAAKLGSRASHGCIRLSIENAKWIYDNIPKGTKVVIE